MIDIVLARRVVCISNFVCPPRFYKIGSMDSLVSMCCDRAALNTAIAVRFVYLKVELPEDAMIEEPTGTQKNGR